MRPEDSCLNDMDIGSHTKASVSIEEINKNHVAIVGISARFSDADNKNEFWNNLLNSKDCIKPFPLNRITDMEPLCEFLKGYIKHIDFSSQQSYTPGGYLDDIASFDYSYFQISPNDAALMDPCQRLFLQGCVEAIHDAGYEGKQLSGSRTGVYAAFSPDYRDFTYKYFIKRTDLSLVPLTLSKNITCSLPAWIAYFLDLKGPNMCVDTGCSASLVALHLACQAIRSGECTSAIVGGVKVDLLPIKLGLKIGIESDDGYCRAFDEGANGTGIGEGAGVVMLKSLDRAVADGDNIYSVIRGSAVNQDGKSRGIMLPNSDAQSDVIIAAIRDANINPETIDYIEAHGTATKVGDPIEIEGIRNAFQRYTDKKQFCAISSVKNNIGHLYEASGMASIIKAALSLENKKIPRTLHFNKGNSSIRFEESPVFVNRKLMEWNSNGQRRRCGISAFGITGTNAHVILEEAPSTRLRVSKRKRHTPEVFAISGVTLDTLLQLIEEYIIYLTDNPSMDLSNLCYTNNLTNSHYGYREAFLVSDTDVLLRSMKDSRAKLSKDRKLPKSDRSQKMQTCQKFKSDMHPETRHLEKRLSNADAHWNDENLRALLDQYMKGCQIDWKRVYRNQCRTRINIPMARLEKHKCWIEPIPLHEERVKNYKHHYFDQAWLKKGKVKRNQNFTYPVVLISEKNTIPTAFIDLIEQRGGEICEISDTPQKAIKKLIDEKIDNKITNIIFWNCTHAEHVYTKEILEKKLETGLLKYFSLLKSVAAGNLFSKVRITLITNNAFIVTAEDKIIGDTTIIPENSTIYGLMKTSKREFADSNLKGIDTDKHTDYNFVIDELVGESEDLVSVFRKNKKFIQQFKFLDLPAKPSSRIKIKKNGVYIITGGTGGLGMAFADYLSKNENCKIALISRSGKAKNTDQENLIQRIETSGSEVSIFQADCANPDQMADTIRTIREKYECIDGVLHCAGVVAENLVKDQSKQKFISIIAPKIHGAVLTDALTADDDLDFFVLFSSVASVFPAMMQGDYAAANTFLDVFAQWRNQQRRNTISINWVAWKEIGMAYDVNANHDTIFKALETEKGLQAFDEIIKHQATNVFVGQVNYSYKYLNKINGYGITIASTITDLMEDCNDNNVISPALNTKNVNTKLELEGRTADDPEYSEVELEIAKIWSHQLGYETLDIFKSFYDLGGDSILAVNIISKVNDQYQVDLKVSDILENPNIYTMAQMVEQKMSFHQENNDDGAMIVAKDEIIGSQDCDNGEIEIPTTWQQRHYYELQAIHEGKTLFNNKMSFLIQGDMDIEKLKEAFQQLINHHDILRSSFRRNKKGKLVQIVKPEMAFELIYEENVNLKDPESLKRFIMPFDLSRTPLVRAFLARLDANEHLLIVDIHHIISDGVTMPIIVEELLAYYQDLKPEENSIQYSEYARYQTSDNYMRKMQKQKIYWMEVLENRENNQVKLLYDFTETNNNKHEASHCAFTFTSVDSKKIRKYCNQENFTSFMLFIAAVKLVLWKQTQQKRIVVGTYSNGRNNTATERSIGIFVNKILLVDEIQKNSKVVEFIQTVKKTLAGALENQEYPFEQLGKDLGLKNTIEKNAIFNVFVLNNVFSKKKFETKNLQVSPFPIENSDALATNYDLTFVMAQDKKKIHFSIVYLKKLFKSETVQQTGNHLTRIILKMINSPDTIIRDL